MSKTASGVRKQAERDAYEYAAAYMAYGEGAGTKRKLIEGTVDYKIHHIPGYEQAFRDASAAQNMADHAKKAKTSNRRRNANAVITRNTRAVATGRYENLNTSLLAIGALAVVIHKSGADKQIVEYTKAKYRQVRMRFRKCSIPENTAAPKSDDKVHKITDVD